MDLSLRMEGLVKPVPEGLERAEKSFSIGEKHSVNHGLRTSALYRQFISRTVKDRKTPPKGGTQSKELSPKNSMPSPRNRNPSLKRLKR